MMKRGAMEEDLEVPAFPLPRGRLIPLPRRSRSL